MYPYTYFLIVFENTIEINLLEYGCVKTKYVYNIFIMFYNLYNIKYMYIITIINTFSNVKYKFLQY